MELEEPPRQKLRAYVSLAEDLFPDDEVPHFRVSDNIVSGHSRSLKGPQMPGSNLSRTRQNAKHFDVARPVSSQTSDSETRTEPIVIYARDFLPLTMAAPAAEEMVGNAGLEPTTSTL